MLKFKYLFDNRDLARMILENWEYDPDSLHLFDQYRISANAVYPFLNKGQGRILRFSPVEERTEQTIEAELDYLRYLRSAGFPVSGTVPSVRGKELERVSTPWGDYQAVVFVRVPGKRLDRIPMNDELITGFGRTLGWLHEISRGYTDIRNKRESWQDQLDRMDHILSDFPDETSAKDEVNMLRSYLEQLPVSETDFGLIHNDFELDNVFYDENTGCFHVIDFDDAVYHWFGLDIQQSLDNLIEEINPENVSEVKELFLEGYRSVLPIDNLMLEAVPVFRRYANVWGYARWLRATNERWNNEPDWMTGLRGILDAVMERRRALFGKPLF